MRFTRASPRSNASTLRHLTRLEPNPFLPSLLFITALYNFELNVAFIIQELLLHFEMHFNTAIISAVLFASASTAMSATVTFFGGPSCTGAIQTQNLTVGHQTCITDTLGGGLAQSVFYSGILPGSSIEFFESGGKNNICDEPATLVLDESSGCQDSPAG